MNEHEKINHVELPATDIEATKAFFKAAFGWTFEDFGPDYTAFSNQGLDGGGVTSDQSATTANGSALIVFYSAELENTESKVIAAGGKIVRETFSFPGGCRFHCSDSSGNEFAVWSDVAAQ